MKKIFYITATLLFAINSFGQLDKNIWLVGGTGSFDSYKQEQSYVFQSTGEPKSAVYNYKNIELTANVGYFIIDKFVAGLKISYIDIYGKSIDNGEIGSRTFTTGPFARYYFLNKEKQFNIITEVNYQFGSISYGRVDTGNGFDGSINTFTFLVGPEFFFNSSVGMEILLGYRNYNRKMDDTLNPSIIENGFQVAIGFQIHLEKK